jgi:hypothetical protein
MVIAGWVLVIISLGLITSRLSKWGLEISEGTRQQTAMQAETNRLLGQLIEILDRDRGDRSISEKA